MPVSPIPVLIFLLAFGGTTISLWVSQTLELVPRCSVFLDGCISISAAGRYPPAVHVFRGTIIPQATLLMLFWPLTSVWLHGLGAGTPRVRAAVAALGGTSPVLLIYYVVGLGQDGVWIEDVRLIIIRIFFVMTLAAQMLTGAVLLRHGKLAAGPRPAVPRWLAGLLLWLAIALLAVALMSVPVHFAMADPSVPLNLMQWYASTAFLIWFVLLWLAWRRTGFRRVGWHVPAREQQT
jgi:hypothetical protein